MGMTQSPHHEGTFRGLGSPNKAPNLPDWSMEHYKSAEF